jgi:hypothetical protein
VPLKNFMHHKKLFTLIILIIISIGASFLYFEYQASKPIKECNKFTDKNENANCLINYAKEKNNVAICENFDENLTGACKRNVYIEQKNILGCEGIKIKYPLDADLCFAGIAKKNANIEICNKIEIPAAKDGCIYQVSQETQNPSYCEKISDPLKMDFCYIKMAQTLKDINYCENVKDTNQLKACFTEYRIVTSENPDCAILKTEEVKMACEESL